MPNQQPPTMINGNGNVHNSSSSASSSSDNSLLHNNSNNNNSGSTSNGRKAIQIPRLILTRPSTENVNETLVPSSTTEQQTVPEIAPEVQSLSPIQIRFIVVLLVICNFCIANGVSLQGPFFPKEAESKGATPLIYSSIFAIYELVMLITSFLFGNLVDRFRPNLMSGTGLTVTGLSTAAFGMLTHLNGPLSGFVALAFALRIVESLGATAFATSSYSFISACFPDRTATMFATMEMAFGLGVITGPVIGGFLYDWGGFLLPFIIIGTVMTVCGTVLVSGPVRRLFMLGKKFGQMKTSAAEDHNHQEVQDNIEDSGIHDDPNFLTVPINEDLYDQCSDDVESNSFLQTSRGNGTTGTFGTILTEKITLRLFLWSPVILIDSFIIITAITLMGFNGATLEPFLRHHEITTSTLYASLMFVALGASYAFTAILWGKACDRWPGRLLQFAIVGAVLTIVGLVAIGPIPILSPVIRPSLWSISGCLILFGIGTSAKQVAGYTHAMNYTIQRRRFPPNQQTYGYISGMFFSCLSFGGFIGPIIGGSLMERWSYPMATAVMLVIEVGVLAILVVIQFFCKSFRI